MQTCRLLISGIPGCQFLRSQACEVEAHVVDVLLDFVHLSKIRGEQHEGALQSDTRYDKHQRIDRTRMVPKYQTKPHGQQPGGLTGSNGISGRARSPAYGIQRAV